MENIFEIKFSFEQNVKDNVILKFSNKQGGAYNVFSYHWQCFVWAAVVGFIHNERRPLQSPIADRPFSLNTMCNGGGEKDAEALLCMCIAKAGSLDIMKEPTKAIDLINEYANGGFYYGIFFLHRNYLIKISCLTHSKSFVIDWSCIIFII